MLQAGGLANVFSTTITPSKPARSKPGVLLRSTLQYGEADTDVLYQFGHPSSSQFYFDSVKEINV